MARRFRNFDILKRDLKKALEKNSTEVEHLRYVIKVASSVCRYYGSYNDFEDLISAGTLGLMYAEKKYRPELGYKFLTYANMWIRRYIQITLQKNSLIKIPDHKLVEHKENPILRTIRLEQVHAEYIPDFTDSYGQITSLETFSEAIWNTIKPRLTSKEYEVLRYRYIDQLSMPDIGLKYGVSKQWIDQILDKAMKKIKNNACTMNQLKLYKEEL